MANLGAIGKTNNLKARSAKLTAPLEAVSEIRPLRFYIDTSGKLSGVVSINEIPTQGILVRLFLRDNNEETVINRLYTKEDGSYEFVGLDQSDKYYITFLDPNKVAPYNFSLIRNHLSPG